MSAITFFAKVSLLFLLLVSAVAVNTGQVTFYTPVLTSSSDSQGCYMTCRCATWYQSCADCCANASLFLRRRIPEISIAFTASVNAVRAFEGCDPA
ncbi:hypothetical protein LshimejAT787_0310610 [Lyophyllum shimeji]|uniref:Uncharacterized protein n=1 Tax=Lyophyllum shimeji TaxID=47721 RepID=A0A9P3UJA9_LYOSH|nr:hypothetical protein LshimejAT787_0310610 [Lyophyllum shimeji]